MPLMRFPLALLMVMAVVLIDTGCSRANGDSTDAVENPPEQNSPAQQPPAQQSAEDPQRVAGGSAAEQAAALPSHSVAGPYPLEVCVVAGGELGSMGEPVTRVHAGREVKFCCAACEPAFMDEPEKYLAKIDQAVVEQQAQSYPLDSCVISGDQLGGTPVDLVFDHRLVRFCCAMCVDTFLKKPSAGLAKLNEAAVAAQRADYPSAPCPVSGQALGSMGDPIDLMIGHRMVRLCCAGCVAQAREQPAEVLEKVYGAPAEPDAE